VEITVETQFTWERNTDYYHALGQSFGVAFYNTWVPEPACAAATAVPLACAALSRRRRQRHSTAGA
jgi:hypothetical protein